MLNNILIVKLHNYIRMLNNTLIVKLHNYIDR